MSKKPYQREPDGIRLAFHGMNTVLPPDKVPPGKYVYAQNVRAYLQEQTVGRATQDAPAETLAASIHSLRRLNDSTPASLGPTLIAGAAGVLYAGTAPVASGMSGDPISLVPFRPNASVQPWMYVGDSVYQKMLKVRSDGTCYLIGIAEPQAAPTVSSIPASDVVSLLGPVTVTYYNNLPSQHSTAMGNFIFKNASDPGGAGPLLSSNPAAGSTTGNSLIFDLVPGSISTPMEWTVYTEYLGTVSTAGTAVTWESGNQFNGLVAGDTIVINALTYTFASNPSNTSGTLTASAGTQSDVDYSAAVITGVTPVFQPALESEGYADFSLVIEATLYIPVAGTYTLTFSSKDETIWGIGNSGTGSASWAGPSGGQILSTMGQTITAQNGYPLLPKTVTNDGGGQVDTASVAVTFSQAGNYPVEFDYDYWYHSNRHLVVQCDGLNIPPIPGTAITEAQYRYTYRSSATGATSNPSPASPESNLSVLANTISATPSLDQQVDKIDFYRQDTGLLQFTYVGTGPNSTAAFSDKLLDTEVAANPILEYDNFQPFPSIDLPQSGIVNVVGGVVEWASGNEAYNHGFNIRWLPGTIIIVGTVAYTLDKRPTDTLHLTASNSEIVAGITQNVPVPDGTGLVYEIAEPDLAAQPLPCLWGPTDNVAFFFGVGDPLRPGTLYWSKGNNPDSAPDTNQQDVTSPSEPLINGCLVNGYGWVASSERGWLIVPNFFNAEATALGTTGSTWTLQESSLKRGLYGTRNLTVDGGGVVYFRAKDGIYASPGGQGGISITDADLFNLFPHEGFTPQPVTRGGFTVYPPNDAAPTLQQLNVANGYLYYDYVYVDASSERPRNVPATLVYDIAAKGWLVDVYQFPVTLHILEEGPNVNGTLVGCSDGSVRPLDNEGAETATSVLILPAFDAGDTRANKHWGDLFIEAGPKGS